MFSQASWYSVPEHIPRFVAVFESPVVSAFVYAFVGSDLLEVAAVSRNDVVPIVVVAANLCASVSALLTYAVFPSAFRGGGVCFCH